MIPIPPLDGSKILMPFLSYNGKQWFENNRQIFYLIFLVIWISGLASTILSPVFRFVANGMVWIVENIFNLFM